MSVSNGVDSLCIGRSEQRKETRVQVLIRCECLAALVCFLYPEDVRNLRLGAIWKYIKVKGFPKFIF